MKKLITILSMFVLGGSLLAQTHRSISFLSVPAIAVTNLIGITNYTGVANPTNLVGVVYTNTQGTRVITSTNNYTKFLLDVPLWADRNGSFQGATYSGTNDGVLAFSPSSCNVSVLLSGQSGANAAITFVLVPLPDGVNESTIAGDAFTFAATATTTTPVCIYTNVPMYKYVGVKALRLKSITNADTDATSRVDVFSVKLNGFVP